MSMSILCLCARCSRLIWSTSVLGGDSRLVFHGIASILPFHVPEGANQRNNLAVQTMSTATTNASLCPIQRKRTADLLSSQRLNLNVRKVRRDGALTLDSL